MYELNRKAIFYDGHYVESPWKSSVEMWTDKNGTNLRAPDEKIKL